MLKILRVKNRSMLPTLNTGDLILVSKFRIPKTGGLVLLKSPDGKGPLLVKRLLGIGGDELSFRNGNLVRNGVVLSEDYVFGGYSSEIKEDATWQIKQDYCLVLSDNRLAIYNSIDSRTFGQIPITSVLGSVKMKIYPSFKIYR